MTISDVTNKAQNILETLEQAIIGKRRFLELLLVGVLADGHLLLEDLPGLAKTLTAKTLAKALGLDFKRIQFTPDLLPSDVTGTHIFNPKTTAFELKTGPVFTQLLLGDEINRAPPKTQAALLEAMQEGQVTLDGQALPLPQPFIVLATQNPIEYEGTFPLPEAQVDRFLMRLEIGYPAPEHEVEMLRRRRQRRQEAVRVEPVADAETLLEMRQTLESVFIDPDLERYMVELVVTTRHNPHIHVGASPRGTLALMKLSRAHAALNGRAFVLPDDVKQVAVPALAHRIILEPDLWLKPRAASQTIEDILARVPVPKIQSPVWNPDVA